MGVTNEIAVFKKKFLQSKNSLTPLMGTADQCIPNHVARATGFAVTTR
jgi:hypothetical protein